MFLFSYIGRPSADHCPRYRGIVGQCRTGQGRALPRRGCLIAVTGCKCRSLGTACLFSWPVTQHGLSLSSALARVLARGRRADSVPARRAGLNSTGCSPLCTSPPAPLHSERSYRVASHSHLQLADRLSLMCDALVQWSDGTDPAASIIHASIGLRQLRRLSTHKAERTMLPAYLREPGEVSIGKGSRTDGGFPEQRQYA
ncbi:hypothetical protein CGRA01v4_02608 [Colletotrichum graminicola]|nr:hypothetical protein CGRA01v4_02608 [Colletotrichum graminicola]